MATADTHLEAAVLRYALDRPRAALRVAQLRPDDMVGPWHSAVVRAMAELVDRRARVTPGILLETLQRGGVPKPEAVLTRIRREAYELHGLEEALSVLRDLGRRRRLKEPLMEAVAMAEAGDVAEAEAMLRQLTASLDADKDPDAGVTHYTSREAALSVLEEVQRRAERPSVDLGPLRPIAEHLHPGSLIVIGGETNSGKSQLGQLIGARWHSSTGARCGIVSVEDGAHVYGDRSIALEVDVSLLSGDITPNALENAERAIARLGQREPYAYAILDRTDITDVERAMRRLHGNGCGLLVVDYLQSIQDRSADARAPQHERIAGIAGRVKTTAKRLGVPVILVSQLARASNRQRGERTMFELKGSGDLENMAEAVVLVRKAADGAVNSLAKVAKLKSGSPGRRVELRRNTAGMIVSIEPVTESDDFDDPGAGV